MDWLTKMREDWDQRARDDSEHFIYTRDSQGDVEDFRRSGEANYNQLVRPYLPILLAGRAANSCRAVEIGCGIGRMTEWFARDFHHVDALDVSPAMIECASSRLGQRSNVDCRIGDGASLEPVESGSADLVFSYIVFQHIPAREVIESYIGEAARVLRAGGAFKFQVNGDQSVEYLQHERDTWLGETFSEAQIQQLMDANGFSVLASEGAGTQYYVVTARKGAAPEQRSYVLPGEPWAEALLLEGFGEAVEGSWRPVGARARVRLTGEGRRLYLGLYFWPESCRHTVSAGDREFRVETAGDHYFEWDGMAGEIEFSIDPPPSKAPAFRVLGVY